MTIARAIAQLRTTDLDGSIRFYVERLGMELAFRHGDFYAGIDADGQPFHLKLVDEPDPSIADGARGWAFPPVFRNRRCRDAGCAFRTQGRALHRRRARPAWGTREFVIEDDQGHTLYFGQPL